MFTLMNFVDTKQVTNLCYCTAFWEGVRDATQRHKYRELSGLEHSFEVCIPDMTGDDWRQGYRHGFLAGKSLLVNRN
jgi:hypothetical protein